MKETEVSSLTPVIWFVVLGNSAYHCDKDHWKRVRFGTTVMKLKRKEWLGM